MNAAAVSHASPMYEFLLALKVGESYRFDNKPTRSEAVAQGKAAWEANARLITAAPDLLESLQAFVRCVEQPETSTWEAYKAARAAIAKAIGE